MPVLPSACSRLCPSGLCAARVMCRISNCWMACCTPSPRPQGRAAHCPLLCSSAVSWTENGSGWLRCGKCICRRTSFILKTKTKGCQEVVQMDAMTLFDYPRPAAHRPLPRSQLAHTVSSTLSSSESFRTRTWECERPRHCVEYWQAHIHFASGRAVSWVMVVAGQLQLFVFYGVSGFDVVDVQLCKAVRWHVGKPRTY